MYEEILTRLAAIISDETGIAPETITDEKSLTDDLDIDSISTMTIIVNVEEEFGISIPDDGVKHLRTVGDIVEYIQNKLAQPE